MSATKGGEDVLISIGTTGAESIKDARTDLKGFVNEAKNIPNIPLDTPVKSLKQQLREAIIETQKLFAEGKKGTTVYTESVKKVAELKDGIQELNRSFAAFDPDNRFKVFAQTAASGAKIVQGYAGALAFLGDTGEEASVVLAKLQGIMAFTDAISSIADIKDSFGDFLSLLKKSKEGAEEQTEATEGAGKAQEFLAATTEGFGTALKGLGIGLLISALTYLITNFNDVKKYIENTFPALKGFGNLVDKLKEIFYGVKNVVTEALITPIKALVDLLTGDFAGAVNDLKNGFNIVKNYSDSVVKTQADAAEAARLVRVQKEVEANERIIKERSALGENTAALELKNQKLKNDLLDKEDKDYAKKFADGQSQLTVIRNGQIKEQQAAADAAAKAADARRKQELAKERAKAKEILDFDKQVSEAYLSDVDKKAVEINVQATKLLIGANAAQQGQIIQDREFLLNNNRRESVATSAANKSQLNLTRVTGSTGAQLGDTPDEARQKTTDLEAAKLMAENDAFELAKVQKEGQYDALAQLEAEHQNKINTILDEGTKARIEIAKKEKDAKENLHNLEVGFLNAASALAGQKTIAGKALAAASAGISTYFTAQKAYESQFLPIASIDSPVRGALAAGAAILTGLTSVKNILSVKIPGDSGGGSGISGAGVSAPVINSTVLKQNDSGANTISQAVNAKQSAIKAYVVNKDLDEQAAKKKFYEQQQVY